MVSMPEAPIHENTGAIFPHHDIRFPRQSGMIQTVTETPTPQKAANHHLRFRVLSVDGGHVPMALLWCEFIRHVQYFVTKITIISTVF